MKLQFKNQKFQSDAAKAVTDSFIGQRNAAMHEYTLDLGSDGQGAFFDMVGFRDSSFEEASQKMNLFELFKQKCQWTDAEVKNNIKVI